MAENYLEIDMSDVREKVSLMRACLSDKQFEQVVERTINEMAKKTKSLTAKQVSKNYAVTQTWARQGIGSYRIRHGGAFPISATIPLTGKRGIIGGRFKLRRPAAYRKKQQIYATIVRTGESHMPLPPKMEHQGGNPPFIGRGKLEGLVFTHSGKDRKPIARVGGLSLAQMPLNRSADDIQEQLVKYGSDRLDKHFDRMLRGKW